MKVWVYTVVHDEALMLRYFVRHYATFAERIVVYDDASTDGTRELIPALDAELRECPWSGLEDLALVDLAHATYPEARGLADWVMWVDVDEFVFHPRGTAQRLQELHDARVPLPNVAGYSMVAERPPCGPGQIYDEIRFGFPDARFAKPVVFQPAIDIAWSAGRHDAYANVPVQPSSDPLRLLHYRYLGAEWHRARNARNYARLNQDNRNFGHGRETYPDATGDHSPAWYAEQVARAVDCIGA